MAQRDHIKFIKSLGYALQGILWTVANERNFRIHLTFVILVIGVSVILSVSKVEAAILSIAITLVLAAELMNTALEKAVDLSIGNKFLPDAKIAKDAAAGAVLVTAINSIIVGLIIFLPKLIILLNK